MAMGIMTIASITAINIKVRYTFIFYRLFLLKGFPLVYIRMGDLSSPSLRAE